MNYEKYINHLPYPTNRKDPDYPKLKEEWNKEMSRTMTLFRSDILDDLGLTDHSKANKLFEMAWDRGHSDGLRAVYEWAERLSRLLK